MLQCIHKGKNQASFYREKLIQPFLWCSDPTWLYSDGLTDIEEGIFTVFKKETHSSVHNVLTRMLSLKFCILSSALNHWVNGKKSDTNQKEIFSAVQRPLPENAVLKNNTKNPHTCKKGGMWRIRTSHWAVLPCSALVRGAKVSSWFSYHVQHAISTQHVLLISARASRYCVV